MGKNEWCQRIIFNFSYSLYFQVKIKENKHNYYDKYGIISKVIENSNRLSHSVYWLGSKTWNKWKQGSFRVTLIKSTFLLLRICWRECSLLLKIRWFTFLWISEWRWNNFTKHTLSVHKIHRTTFILRNLR